MIDTCEARGMFGGKDTHNEHMFQIEGEVSIASLLV